MICVVLISLLLSLKDMNAMEKGQDDKPTCVLISNRLDFTENDKVGATVMHLRVYGIQLKSGKSLPFLHEPHVPVCAYIHFLKYPRTPQKCPQPFILTSCTGQYMVPIADRIRKIEITGCCLTEIEKHGYQIKRLLQIPSADVKLQWKKIMVVNYLRTCGSFMAGFHYNPALQSFLCKECEVVINGLHIPHGQEKSVHVPCYSESSELKTGALIVQFRDANLKKTYKTAIFALKNDDVREAKLANCYIKGTDFTPSFIAGADLIEEDFYPNNIRE